MKLVKVINDLFKHIFEADIPCIHMRYKSIDEENIYRGDFDLFLPKEYLDKVLEIIFEICSSNSINFYIDSRKYGKTKIVLFGSEQKKIVLEIWNFLDVKDIKKKIPKFIDPNLTKQFIIKEDDQFKFDLEIEALYYVSHLYSKSKDLNNIDVKNRLEYYFNKLQKLEICKCNFIVTLFGSLLFGEVSTKEASIKVNSYLIDIGFFEYNALFSRFSFTIRTKMEINKIYAKFLLFTNIVPFVGPDGVGKTSVIEKSIEDNGNFRYYRFKKMYRKSFIYEIVHKVYKMKLNAKKINFAKNEIDDKMAIWNLVISVLNYPILFLYSIIGGKIILSDRYFYEFLFNDLRDLHKKAYLNTYSKYLLKCVPNNYFLVHLDCDTDLILARKNELSRNNIDFFRSNMFKIILMQKPMIYTYINTSNDIYLNNENLKYVLKLGLSL